MPTRPPFPRSAGDSGHISDHNEIHETAAFLDEAQTFTDENIFTHPRSLPGVNLAAYLPAGWVSGDDATSAIAAWASASVGKRGVCPPGLELGVSSAINLPGNIDLDFANCTIKVAAGTSRLVTPLRVLGKANVTIRNLTIDGNHDARVAAGEHAADEVNAGNGIRVQTDASNNRSSDIFITNCHVKDVRSYGFSIRGAEFVRILACTAEDYGDDGFDIGGQNHTAGDFVPARVVSITNCIAKGGIDRGFGYLMDGFEVDDGAEHITFTGCISENDITAGFDIHDRASQPIPVHDVAFGGCTVRRPGLKGFSIASTDELFDKTHNITLTGCTVEDIQSGTQSYRAVHITNCRNVTVGNVTAKGANPHSIHLSGKCEDVTITGSDVASVVLNDGPLSRVVIANNTLVGSSGSGVVLQPSSGLTASSVRIEGNIIANPVGDGIQVRRSVDVAVIGNHISGHGTRGISIILITSGQNVRSIVTANHIRGTASATGNTTDGIYLDSPNSIVANNYVEGGAFGVRVWSSDVTIEHNEFVSQGTRPIHLSPNTQRITIIGNRLNVAVSASILGEGTNSDITIVGNLIRGSTGNAIQSNSAPVRWVIVGNNYFGQGLSGSWGFDTLISTNIGTPHSSAPRSLGPWTQDNVAASQTGVVLNLYGDTTRSSRLAVRAGSITGIVVRSNEARTAGTLTVEVTKNGVGTGLTAVLDGSNTTFKATTQATGLDTYVAGDEIGVTITTNAGWLPTTADVSVEVEVVE